MYTKHPMKKGDIVSVDDIIYTAPAYGIYAKYEEIVVGQKLNQDIGENMPITWDILGGSSVDKFFFGCSFFALN